LNLIEQGHDYGWPACYGRGVFDKLTARRWFNHQQRLRAHHTDGARLYSALRADCVPLLHRLSISAELHEQCVHRISWFWNRQNPKGYKVVRVRFSHGQPMGFQDFCERLAD